MTVSPALELLELHHLSVPKSLLRRSGKVTSVKRSGHAPKATAVEPEQDDTGEVEVVEPEPEPEPEVEQDERVD